MPLSAVSPRTLATVSGAHVPVPHPDRLIHLQFRRFAGCPVCNLHLRSIVVRLADIEAAGIHEVVVFHSGADALRTYTADLPLDVVADPDRVLYREFGVEYGPPSLLDPRGWPTIARAVAQEIRAVRRRERPAPPARPDGGRLGLPADFLIAPDGRVLASKHGVHLDDQWSVDELLTLAPTTERNQVPPAGSPAHVSTAQLPAGRTGEPAEYVQYEARSAGTPSENLDPPIHAPDSRWGALA